MFGIGTQEFLVIMLVVLLLFGGKRIPEVGRSIGTALRDFRKALNDVQREVDLDGVMRTPPPEKPRLSDSTPVQAAAAQPPAAQGAPVEPSRTKGEAAASREGDRAGGGVTPKPAG